MRAFADALDAVPMALAENSGLSPIETLASIKSRQVNENNSRLGVDCMQTGSNGILLSLPFWFNPSLRVKCLFRIRYAKEFRNRPLDWKTTAIVASDAIMSHGFEGMLTPS